MIKGQNFSVEYGRKAVELSDELNIQIGWSDKLCPWVLVDKNSIVSFVNMGKIGKEPEDSLKSAFRKRIKGRDMKL